MRLLTSTRIPAILLRISTVFRYFVARFYKHRSGDGQEKIRILAFSEAKQPGNDGQTHENPPTWGAQGRSCTFLNWRRAIFPDGDEARLTEHFFRGTDHGFFVDVGAYEPVDQSQSWPLEQRGWRGVLVEPRPDLAD